MFDRRYWVVNPSGQTVQEDCYGERSPPMDREELLCSILAVKERRGVFLTDSEHSQKLAWLEQGLALLDE